MNKLVSTPFPRPSFKTYSFAAASVALTIIFILLVFQPFNTNNFQHPNKTLLLIGYGAVVFAILLIYYWMSLFVINKPKEKNWTVVWEVVDIFASVILSILACYFYASWILGFQFGWNDVIAFLLSAASVALFPVLIYLGFIYIKWRDVIRSTLEKPSNKQSVQDKITLTGTNKTDRIETSIDHVLYLKAQDNYVMLHLEQEGKVQRHMIRSTLTQMIAQLNDPCFLKVHRSYVVNTQKIEALQGNKSKANLSIVGVKGAIPVARSSFDEVKELV